jgi:hypothetical protein
MGWVKPCQTSFDTIPTTQQEKIKINDYILLFNQTIFYEAIIPASPRTMDIFKNTKINPLPGGE